MRQDQVPICALANLNELHKAPQLADVAKQTLSAKSTMVFAAYAEGCIHETCDQLPSLQCTVDREGSTLIVHSRYSAYHKDGATCTTDCRRVNAGCETPVLEAGTYTVQHGDHTYKLKIPSVLGTPCFAKH